MFAIDTIADRLELEHVVWSLGRCLDERDFDGLRQIFTTDATVTTAATASGHDALVEQARRRHSRDKGLQHIIANLITDVDGDQANGRANLLVSFARTGADDPAPYLIGEVYRFAFRRTPQGWRITSMTSTRTWSLNQPQPTSLDPLVSR
jgi:SnoaL-like domain